VGAVVGTDVGLGVGGIAPSPYLLVSAAFSVVPS
jgi:hypothetical protein